jgi:hypothetical protein
MARRGASRKRKFAWSDGDIVFSSEQSSAALTSASSAVFACLVKATEGSRSAAGG